MHRLGMKSYVFLACGVLLNFAGIGPASASDAVEQAYANQCNAEIGFPVPDFDCNDPAFTDVPVSHPNGSSCDFPNRLNGVCDPGSRFRIFKSPPDQFGVSRQFVAVHCRKKGNPGNTFGDIAAIQHNIVSGATCFFQEGPAGGLRPQVSAPKNALGNQWNTMPGNAATGCASCHNNGAIIRSPYFDQVVSGPNIMPGVNNNAFNNPHSPYYLVGDTTMKAYNVHIDGNECVSCHRMGMSTTGGHGAGAALKFGLLATETDINHNQVHEASKNPDSPASPLWMPPGSDTPNNPDQNAAIAIAKCATQFADQGFKGPLPQGCTISRYNVPFGIDVCKQGFVWREAFEFDHVCVPPATRAQAWSDNAQASARRQPGGGPFGPDTCKQGFVWREAEKNNPLKAEAVDTPDHVCVVPFVRSAAAADNAAALTRNAPPPL